MASPLSPTPSAMLNAATPTTTRQIDAEDTNGLRSPSNGLVAGTADGSANLSSPFVSEVQDSKIHTSTKENVSPSKIRHSRILSGNEIAPLKILSPREENFDIDITSSTRQDTAPKSPRKPLSPEKRFPIKPVSSSPAKSSPRSPDKQIVPEKQVVPEKQAAPEKQVIPEMHAVNEQEMTLEDALKANEGLKKAIQIFEDESTMLENDDPNATAMTVDHQMDMGDETAGPDTSMASTFSTFSAVPNMTMFAKIGHSPTRFANMDMAPPSARGRQNPSPSRTSRPMSMHEIGNSTSIMDFTDHMSGFPSTRGPPSPSRRTKLSPAKTADHRTNATPQRHNANLLDFDLPPMATPRSVPTVTAREVETLKSQFLSEISSLKASLLGKEAEVNSLKTAVTDAEKRVGDTSEQLRELKCLKETLIEEKESYETRCKEMETVLRKVKTEIHHGQRERQELESKLEESEKRREAAEIMAQEAESKMAGMRAGKTSSDSGADIKSPEKDARSPGSREVEIAVERVARELHALYKTKHENKVTALKKSYENRWERKVRGLEAKLEELTDENERIKLNRDNAVTKVDAGQAAENQELKAQAMKNLAHITELNAEVKKLGAVINSVKQDNQELIQLLEKERVEKGELVSLAEEMMSMQHSFVQQEKTKTPARPTATRMPEPLQSNTKSSLTRPAPSALRAPGSVKKSRTESRIGGISHERTKSAGGLPRPGMLGARSGIMSSIEKMGNYRGRPE